ncbi:MAG: hypothetical protein OXS47_11525 [Chloroflexota bacterium]|nr:hypothetical protein [Chloroflexota bacterium]
MSPIQPGLGFDDALFREVTEPLLAAGEVEEGTIMGFPCLRTSRGEFLAMAEHRSGDLIVKVPAGRVEELVEAGTGLPFTPAGRRFREWVHVPGRDADLWQELLDEGLAFVDGGPA